MVHGIPHSRLSRRIGQLEENLGVRHACSWCLDGPNGAIATIPHDPRLVSEDMAALRFVALEGIGMCQLPVVVIRDDLKANRLVDILPKWQPRAGIVHAAFPSRRGLLPSVRVLLDFLADEYAGLNAAGRPNAGQTNLAP